MNRVSVVLIASALALAGCSSSGGSSGGGKSYKTVTCGVYADLINAPDAVTNGALSIASDYMNALGINPAGGAADAAAIGDQIVSSCDTATPDTKIIRLKSQVEAVFLVQHPQAG